MPVGLAAAFVAYRGMFLAALVYGELVQSAFDLYRLALYKQLRWSPPAGVGDEVARDERLTAYLFRGV